MSASILFPDASARTRGASQSDDGDLFADLNLDQIETSITTGKQEYDLAAFFHAPLTDADAVVFRHEVMQDLGRADLLDRIKTFAGTMQSVRSRLAELEKRYYEHQRKRWFLDAVDSYCDGVKALLDALSAPGLESRGLRAFREYLSQYASSEAFASLADQTKQLEAELSAIRYSILIRGPRVEIRPYGGETDYSVEVEAAFDRFRQGAVKEYAFSFSDSENMDHIEARILDGVAELNKDLFGRLAQYRSSKKDFLDPEVANFDREMQFYVAFLEYIAPLKRLGLAFCYPTITQSRSDVYGFETFDVVLAVKLAGEGRKPVCNDFYLRGSERIIVVSGPNQGGKTTFARSFGQLHYLARLGYPVPGTRSQLFLSNRILTHFERQERTASLRGKLEDDIMRMHAILEAATPQSIVIINEIFTSTTLRDALFLSKKMAAALMELDALCVWVTFLDELASLSRKTVSMVSTVVPEDPATRTFKVLRQPANGLAFAISIAEKYRLTYDQIMERARS